MSRRKQSNPKPVKSKSLLNSYFFFKALRKNFGTRKMKGGNEFFFWRNRVLEKKMRGIFFWQMDHV